MQFVQANGVTLHFQQLSAGEDKPRLVFINSLGTDFRIWRDVIVDMAGQASMLAYDKRGHGLSSIGNTPYSMDDHIDDLIALMEHLAIPNAVLCGVSVGGMIALGVCAKRPDLVSAVILCDTGHKIGSDEMWNNRIAAVEKGGIEALSEPILERWFSSAYLKDNPTDLDGYRNMLTRQTVAGYNGTCAAIRDCDLTDAARGLTIPAMCVVGDEDGSTPPQLVEELSNLIADSRFEIIEGSGHLPSIEQPHTLSGYIKSFLVANLKLIRGAGELH